MNQFSTFSLAVLIFYSLYYLANLFYDFLYSKKQSSGISPEISAKSIPVKSVDSNHFEELQQGAIAGVCESNGGVSLGEILELCQSESIEFVKKIPF